MKILLLCIFLHYGSCCIGLCTFFSYWKFFFFHFGSFSWRCFCWFFFSKQSRWRRTCRVAHPHNMNAKLLIPPPPPPPPTPLSINQRMWILQLCPRSELWIFFRFHGHFLIKILSVWFCVSMSESRFGPKLNQHISLMAKVKF